MARAIQTTGRQCSMFGNFAKMFVLTLCAAMIIAVSAGTWGTMCSGQSSNRVRGCDSYGCGNYGAKRGSRLHQGVDVLCSDGSTVYAPFTGTLGGAARPYVQNNAINDGVKLSASGVCVKIFYIKPTKYSGSIKKGDKLGTLLPMQRVYPGIQSHVHIQHCDTNINPTPNL